MNMESFCICKECPLHTKCNDCHCSCQACASAIERCPARSISVIYWDGTYGVVKDVILDELICSAEIKQFLRSGGWAVLGCDPIRIEERVSLASPLRRPGMYDSGERADEAILPVSRII